MNRYMLAKLVSMAGPFDSRKRVQKMVYVLQWYGCPFGAKFHAGQDCPISTGLADTLDHLVADGFLVESRSDVSGSTRYTYTFNEDFRSKLEQHEATEAGALAKSRLDAYAGDIAALASMDTGSLLRLSMSASGPVEEREREVRATRRRMVASWRKGPAQKAIAV